MFDGLRSRYPDTVFDIGGSGYDLKKVLPSEIENMKPDYTYILKSTTALGILREDVFETVIFVLYRSF